MADDTVPSENFDLAHAVEHYQHALLDALAAIKASEPATPTILKLLLCRDAVEAVRQQLGHRQPQQTAIYLQLVALDQQLKENAESFANYVDFADYRQSIKPNESSWWWFLDPPSPEPKVHRHDRFDWVWNGLTVVFLVSATSFVTTTAQAFLSQGVDLLGLFSSFSQGAGLALVAGGTFTDKGRKTVENILDSVSIPQHFHAETTCALSALVLLSSWAVSDNLSRLGEFYYKQGQQHSKNGQTIQALEAFQRSLNFDPEYSLTYSALGRIYEKTGRLDDAIAHYEKGYGLSGDSGLSALGLARVTLLKALKEKGWTSEIDNAIVQDIAFLLEVAQNFNDEQYAITGDWASDVFIEVHTHLGLLELAKAEFKGLPYGEYQETMGTSEKEHSIEAKKRLNRAVHLFQTAHLEELRVMMNWPSWQHYESVTDALKKRAMEQELIETPSETYDLEQLLNRLPEKESIEIIENFITSLPESQLNQINNTIQNLAASATFDMGKPRCYAAITEFIHAAVPDYSQPRSSEQLSLNIGLLREKNRYAEDACGSDERVKTPPAHYIDISTLNLHDRVLMDKFLGSPSDVLPPDVYND
ncbi:MAG: tetratricopeptide repeat protein [Cyanobacteria bacterium P01_H01_bin.21]